MRARAVSSRVCEFCTRRPGADVVGGPGPFKAQLSRVGREGGHWGGVVLENRPGGRPGWLRGWGLDSSRDSASPWTAEGDAGRSP